MSARPPNHRGQKMKIWHSDMWWASRRQRAKVLMMLFRELS